MSPAGKNKKSDQKAKVKQSDRNTEQYVYSTEEEEEEEEEIEEEEKENDDKSIEQRGGRKEEEEGKRKEKEQGKVKRKEKMEESSRPVSNQSKKVLKKSRVAHNVVQEKKAKIAGEEIETVEEEEILWSRLVPKGTPLFGL